MREPKSTYVLTQEDMVAQITAAKLLGLYEAAEDAKSGSERGPRFAAVIVRFKSTPLNKSVPGWFRVTRKYFPRHAGSQFLTHFYFNDAWFYCLGFNLRADLVFKMQSAGLVVLTRRKRVCLTNKARSAIGDLRKLTREQAERDRKLAQNRRRARRLPPLKR